MYLEITNDNASSETKSCIWTPEPTSSSWLPKLALQPREISVRWLLMRARTTSLLPESRCEQGQHLQHPGYPMAVWSGVTGLYLCGLVEIWGSDLTHVLHGNWLPIWTKKKDNTTWKLSQNVLLSYFFCNLECVDSVWTQEAGAAHEILQLLREGALAIPLASISFPAMSHHLPQTRNASLWSALPCN